MPQQQMTQAEWDAEQSRQRNLKTTHSPTPWSQVSCIGLPPPKSWDDYEAGCHATFGGGYHTEAEREIFRHGMSTVFNLLRAEFPPAEACKAHAALVEACRAVLAHEDSYTVYHIPPSLKEELRAAIAAAEGGA